MADAVELAAPPRGRTGRLGARSRRHVRTVRRRRPRLDPRRASRPAIHRRAGEHHSMQPAPAPGKASDDERAREHRPGRRSRRPARRCACRTCAATPPTCSPPPKPNAGNPPKRSGRCSPRSSPAAKPHRSTPAARPPGSPPARPSTPGTSPPRSIPAPTQRSLRTLEWIDQHENLVVCGPSGTGKSHLLEALGHAAIDHGAHVHWFSLESLGALFHRHRADDTTDPSHPQDHARRPHLHRRHRPAPRHHRHRRSALPRRRRRLREDAPSPCPPTCTPPASTSSCPRPSPTPPSTGSCTTPTSSSPPATPSASPKPPRQGGEAPGQLDPGSSAGHHWAVLVATTGQFY